MGVEFELKFAATPEQHRAIRGAYAGAWQRIVMETTYYDTPDGLFARKQMTLRRRMENGVSICTLKTPEKDGMRGEWELKEDSIAAALEKLCKLSGDPELETEAKGELVPICGARFTRHALTLSPEGCTVELALDAGSLLGGGREAALCEIEVEMKSGEEAAVAAFARELAERFSLREEKKSKFRRALALAEGE